MLFLVLHQVLKVLTVECTLLDLMKFLLISGHLMNSGENANDVLIFTQQFQLLAIFGQIIFLYTMPVRLVVAQLLCQAYFKILQ